jgi:cellobiose-specific phosphotransferase system component IIA
MRKRDSRKASEDMSYGLFCEIMGLVHGSGATEREAIQALARAAGELISERSRDFRSASEMYSVMQKVAQDILNENTDAGQTAWAFRRMH